MPRIRVGRRRKQRRKKATQKNPQKMTAEEAFEKVWDGECESCGASPVLAATGMCGPCTFGEADTIGGNW